MLALAGVALGISAAVSASQHATENTAKEINALSNEIYKLQEKANAIKTIEKQYDALDNKIVQTAADQEKMNELLDQAKDKLSSEGKEGKTEQDIYAALSTNAMKRTYLAQIEEKAIREANAKRREQISILKEASAAQRKEMLTSKDNADYLMVQDAILAINNNTLYEYIDSLDKVADGVESFTQAILESMSAEEAYRYATDKTGTGIKKLVDIINGATTVIEDEQVALATILDSSKYTIAEKIDAYNELSKQIAALGDPTLMKAFETAYGQ